MPTNPPPETTLRPLGGDPQPLAHFLTTFHLVVVVLDPFTLESAWLLETGARVLENFSQADCRVAWLVTAEPDDCREFLGPHARRFLTFSDPDREFVKALGLERLPALVDIGLDASVIDAAEGWRPADWRRVSERLERVLSWKGPTLPGAKDPAPFEGSPAVA